MKVIESYSTETVELVNLVHMHVFGEFNTALEEILS